MILFLSSFNLSPLQVKVCKEEVEVSAIIKIIRLILMKIGLNVFLGYSLYIGFCAVRIEC